MIARVALRNLVRHRQRTLITALALALSFAVLIVFMGLSDGGHQAMSEVGVRMGLGHVVVNAAGYLENPSLDRHLTNPDTVEQAFRDLSDVDVIVPRVRSDAFIQAGSESFGITISGVDPAREERASRIARPSSIVRGEALTGFLARGADTLHPIVIGRVLAANLQVAPGDRVVVTLKPAGSHELRSSAFRVSGVFRTGVLDVDTFWAEAPLPAVQELTGLGQGVTAVAVILKDASTLDSAIPALHERLPASGYEVLPWSSVAPELNTAIALDEAGLYFLMLVIFLVVTVGVVNTVLTSVLERTREFSVMLALGARPHHLLMMVLTESMLLSVSSVAAGIALGLGVHLRFASAGFDFKSVMGSSFEASGVLLPDVFYSTLSASKVALSVAIVVILTMLGALYPAFKTARLQPAEGMRNV